MMQSPEHEHVVDFLVQHNSSFAEAGVVLTKTVGGIEPELTVVVATVVEDALIVPQPRFAPPVAAVVLDPKGEIIALARDLGDRAIVNRHGPDVEFFEWRPETFPGEGHQASLGFRCVFGRASGMAGTVNVVDTTGQELDSCAVSRDVFVLTFIPFGEAPTLEVRTPRGDLLGSMRIAR